MKQDAGHREGYITFDELRESWNEGNESILSFAGGAVIAILTDGMDKLAQSRWGKWFGLGSLAFLAAACGTSPVNSFATPEITPAAPPTPTLVSPGENMTFHTDIDINSSGLSLVSRNLGVPALDVAYPGAMQRLRALNFDPNKMSFVQFTVADGGGGDEEYLVAVDPTTDKVLIPWEIDDRGWGTPDQLESPEGNRYEWSEADVTITEDGGFEISALNGRYSVIQKKVEDGEIVWSVGLPLLDKNTGKNVVVDEVLGGGGMLFAPAAFLNGQSGVDESEQWNGVEYTPGAQGVENNSTIESTVTPTAEVAMTPEKWQDFLNIEAVVWSDDGIKYNMGKEIANLSEVVSVEEVVKLPLGTPIVVFGADGMVTCGADPAEAAKLGQGGVIRVDTTTKELGMMPVNVCRLAYKAAVAQYKLGNKGVRLSFGEIGFTPMRANPLSLSVNDIVLEKAADGSIVSPILMKPKYYWLRKGDKMMESQGGDNWIQELIAGGYDEIEIFLTKPPQIIG